jgi:hypothetical protein
LGYIHAVFILPLLPLAHLVLFIVFLALALFIIFLALALAFLFFTVAGFVVDKRIMDPPFFGYDFAMLVNETYKYILKYTHYVTYSGFVSLSPYFIRHLRRAT